ncbi:ArsR/SmtB family transcription factor [Thermosulfuriphilus sp.]
MARFFKALADENRLRIVNVLMGGEHSVGQLVEELGLSQPLVSHHLRELKMGGLVTTRREGPFIYYSLKDRQRTMAIFDLVKDIISGGGHDHQVSRIA